ncbi:hypothetical protein [Streptomyces sp. R44]|uniref:Uncharacterized protein n=1 Tax=Streptomyces sp. R44 TaxID=3238633 RepID=A0AB39T2A6_9ACTN
MFDGTGILMSLDDSGKVVYHDEWGAQYGLVTVRDFGTEEAPTFDSGEEEYVFLPSNLILAVRPDTEGDVTVEVRVGGADFAGHELLLEARMMFSSSVVVITTPTYVDEESLHLPRAGSWAVKVWVNSRPRPDSVILTLEPSEWNSVQSGWRADSPT